MNTVADRANQLNPTEALALIDATCRRIAPVWPLDSFVAVNPYLALLDRPFRAVGRYLAQTTGEYLYMDRAWFAQKIAAGAISEADLALAAQQLKCVWPVAQIKQAARHQPPTKKSLPLLAWELNRRDAPPFLIFVTEQVSGYLAAHYDRGQALWHLPAEPKTSLYAAWRRYTLIDRSAAAAGLRGVRANLKAAPELADDAVLWALEQIDLPPDLLADYLFATLKSIGGWASYCRYLLWQAELIGETQRDLCDLLAIRLVWDALILMEMDDDARERWRFKMAEWQRESHGDAQRDADNTAPIDDILLTAAEIALRRRVQCG